MEWSKPEYSKRELDWAGSIIINDLASDDDQEQAFTIINNWRSAHYFPLNTFQMGLRQKTSNIPSTLVSQRIKRISSIKAKLTELKTMKFSQMQDIGGCRAVMPLVRDVEEVLEVYKESSLKHKLLRVVNYIESPRKSGYRSVHLIYRYFSDRNKTYNGLQIEIQLRSKLQHSWATAVETVGTFLKQALKSSKGHDRWLRFFMLMGSAIAMREKTTLVPDTPRTKQELINELREIVRELDVINRLSAYGMALKTMEDISSSKEHQYYLLALNPANNELNITGYLKKELEFANDEYLKKEREFSSIPGADAVIVSVESLATLRKAYPNYFLDTRLFQRVLSDAIK